MEITLCIYILVLPGYLLNVEGTNAVNKSLVADAMQLQLEDDIIVPSSIGYGFDQNVNINITPSYDDLVTRHRKDQSLFPHSKNTIDYNNSLNEANNLSQYGDSTSAIRQAQQITNSTSNYSTISSNSIPNKISTNGSFNVSNLTLSLLPLESSVYVTSVPSSNPSVLFYTSTSLSQIPSVVPSTDLSQIPSIGPSTDVSQTPSIVPSTALSQTPSIDPSAALSQTPSIVQSTVPSPTPSSILSLGPTYVSQQPSNAPSVNPTGVLSQIPSISSSNEQRRRRQSLSPLPSVTLSSSKEPPENTQSPTKNPVRPTTPSGPVIILTEQPVASPPIFSLPEVPELPSLLPEFPTGGGTGSNFLPAITSGLLCSPSTIVSSTKGATNFGLEHNYALDESNDKLLKNLPVDLDGYLSIVKGQARKICNGEEICLSKIDTYTDHAISFVNSENNSNRRRVLKGIFPDNDILSRRAEEIIESVLFHVSHESEAKIIHELESIEKELSNDMDATSEEKHIINAVISVAKASTSYWFKAMNEDNQYRFLQSRNIIDCLFSGNHVTYNDRKLKREIEDFPSPSKRMLKKSRTHVVPTKNGKRRAERLRWKNVIENHEYSTPFYGDQVRSYYKGAASKAADYQLANVNNLVEDEVEEEDLFDYRDYFSYFDDNPSVNTNQDQFLQYYDDYGSYFDDFGSYFDDYYQDVRNYDDYYFQYSNPYRQSTTANSGTYLGDYSGSHSRSKGNSKSYGGNVPDQEQGNLPPGYEENGFSGEDYFIDDEAINESNSNALSSNSQRGIFDFFGIFGGGSQSDGLFGGILGIVKNLFFVIRADIVGALVGLILGRGCITPTIASSFLFSAVYSVCYRIRGSG